MLFALASCQTPQKSRANPTAAAQPISAVGVIAIVDEERRFVLIDLQSNLRVPSPGTRLLCISPTGATAHLQTTAEQKRPFIAADILDGNPALGDRVMR